MSDPNGVDPSDRDADSDGGSRPPARGGQPEADPQQTAGDDAEEFAELVDGAPVVDAGHDPDYVPDSPRLQEQMEEDDG